MDKTICELFAGVGGFHLGFERLKSGWEVVWYSQWEPNKAPAKQFANSCYVRHFGTRTDIHGAVTTNEDIHNIDKTTIPDHTVLVADYPYQDFSVHGIDESKGALWWQVRATIEAKRPAFCILENADRILKSPASQRGRDFGIMLSCLDSLGYGVEWRIVDASNYGVPQRRCRVFIFAYHKDTLYGKEMSAISAEDIIMKHGLMAKAFPVIDISKPIIRGKISHDISEMHNTFKFSFLEAGHMIDSEITTTITRIIPETEIPLKAILQTNVSSGLYLTNPDQVAKICYLKQAKKLGRCVKNGHTYSYSAGSVSFPDNINVPARTIMTSEGLISRTAHVIRDPEAGMLRFLSLVEVERLNGFDDHWTGGMPDRARYFCMGNALVVPMVTRMGAVLDTLPDFESIK